jgi:hypothetical protein
MKLTFNEQHVYLTYGKYLSCMGGKYKIPYSPPLKALESLEDNYGVFKLILL